MSDRKEITKFLSKLLERDKFSGRGNYWGKEVVIDYGTENVKRIDYMKYEPVNQLCIDGLEKGVFKGYEVKSCKEDFNSGFGQNYICEYNYIVITMQTYKELLHTELNKLPYYVGILVSIPHIRGKSDKNTALNEFENTTSLPENYCIENWKLYNIRNVTKTYRKKSMLELMFCLLRNRC